MIAAALVGAAVTITATATPAHAEERSTTPKAITAPSIHGSISCGSANRGALAFGAIMPPSGPSWVVPETWARRGFQYGTDELVGPRRSDFLRGT